MNKSDLKRIRKFVIGLLLFCMLAGLTPWVGNGPAAAEAAAIVDEKLDPALVAELELADLETPLEVVIAFSDLSIVSEVELLASTFYQMQELPMAGAILTKGQIEALAQRPEVYSITLNSELEYFLDESVAYIGADQVWTTYGQTGGNTTVAVIDSGIDATHPDLLFGVKTIQNVKVLPYGPGIENVPNTDNTSGHGTHVASTIGGVGIMSDGHYKGVAPDVNLVGLGAGEAIAILTAVQAYDWVLQHHAEYDIRVVSNSWGSSGGDLNMRNPVTMATYEAYKRGILSVFAAGNDGGYDILNPYSLAPWVLSVAAGDKSGQLADFSSRGKDGDFYKHPDITAPGVNIYAARCSCIGITALDPLTNPVNPLWTYHYTTMNGTSMATPHVSGSAALLFSSNPQLSPDQVIDLLINNATPMPDYLLHEAGYGYLNALAAFEASLDTSGNMEAFLAGDRLYNEEEILGFDPDSMQYDVRQYSGYSAVGLTTMPANEYPITVDAGLAYVSVELTWEPQAEDAYDLEIVDPNGNVVASSGNSAGEPEGVLFVPEMNGDFILRILPFAGFNSQYTATVTRAYGEELENWPPENSPAYDQYLGVTNVYKSYGAMGLASYYMTGGDSLFIPFTLIDNEGQPILGSAEMLQAVYSDVDGNVVFVDDNISERSTAGEYQTAVTLDDAWTGVNGHISVNFAWTGSQTMRAQPTGFAINHLETTLSSNATEYYPGDTISFSGTVMQWNTVAANDVDSAAVGGASVSVSLQDSEGNILASAELATDLEGNYSGTLVSPDTIRGLVTLVAEATYEDPTISGGPSNWAGRAEESLTFPGNLAPEVTLAASSQAGQRNRYYVHVHATAADPDGLNDIEQLTVTITDAQGRQLKKWRQSQFSPIDGQWMLTRGYKVSGQGPWTVTITAVDSAGNMATASSTVNPMD